jgi:membrane protease YdiL (CAAX protease family)
MWALVHPFSIAGYILIILFGMFLAYTYSKTKMLVVPIGIHSIVNLSIDLGSATHYYGLSW